MNRNKPEDRYGGHQEYRGPRAAQDQGQPSEEFDDARTRGGLGPRVDAGTSGEDQIRTQATDPPRQDMPGEERHHSFAGRGPKSYHRSDERILEEIHEQLTRHPDIDAEEVNVIVQDGEVTLTGTVHARSCKHLAEDVAENVFGVQDVHNEIRVIR